MIHAVAWMRCMLLPCLNWVRVACASGLTIFLPTPIPPGILPFGFKLSSTLADTAITSYESSPLLAWQNLLSVLHKQETSRHLFQQLHSQLLITGFASTCSLLLWNALLRHYALGIFPKEALYLYKFASTSYSPPFAPDSFTYNFLLKACANSQHMSEGIQVHALSLKDGFDSHIYVQTALLNMYAVHGFLFEAEKVFNSMPLRNSVTWNAMITGLTKWGRLSLARALFNEMPTDARTVVSWTGIIDGYTRMNQPTEAMSLFQKMTSIGGKKPTEITILAIIPAISNLGDLKNCQCIHAYSEKNGYKEIDIRVANSLVDAYAKCGCIVSAFKFFYEIPSESRTLVSWTTIISSFSMHGMAEEAIENFERMEKECFRPNSVSFLSILNACSHGGLVDVGLKIFNKMVNDCQILPDVKHYGCVIDMLGRAGRLEEAEKLALEIPSGITNDVIWRTLLGACSFHGDIEIGKRATRKILEIQEGYGGDYVLLSNIFASAGRFGDVESVRRLMDMNNASKVPGRSLV
ncbi:Pentatricopeptide repeat [Dillenia turbinata]|uniref:Pentatricopeptide repeat n=1 Tax=Dillenia turbinata TaxID=194707 RepID=A0AAN8VKT2_9MAGN